MLLIKFDAFLSFQLLALKPNTLSKAHFPGISFIRTSNSPTGSNFVTLEPGGNWLTFLASTCCSSGFSGFYHKSALELEDTCVVLRLALPMLPTPDLVWTPRTVTTVLGFSLPGTLLLSACTDAYFVLFNILHHLFWPHLTHFRVLLKSLENITLSSDVGPELSTQVNFCM